MWKRGWAAICALSVILGLLPALELSCFYFGHLCIKGESSIPIGKSDGGVSDVPPRSGSPHLEVVRREGWFSCRSKVDFVGVGGAKLPPFDAYLQDCPEIGTQGESITALGHSTRDTLTRSNVTYIGPEQTYLIDLSSDQIYLSASEQKGDYASSSAAFTLYAVTPLAGVVRQFKFKCYRGNGKISHVTFDPNRRVIDFRLEGLCNESFDFSGLTIRNATGFDGSYDSKRVELYKCVPDRDDCRFYDTFDGRYTAHLSETYEVDKIVKRDSNS